MYRYTKPSGQFHTSAFIACETPNPTYYNQEKWDCTFFTVFWMILWAIFHFSCSFNISIYGFKIYPNKDANETCMVRWCNFKTQKTLRIRKSINSQIHRKSKKKKLQFLIKLKQFLTKTERSDCVISCKIHDIRWKSKICRILVSITSSSSVNFNAADITRARLCVWNHGVSIQCYVTSKNQCIVALKSHAYRWVVTKHATGGRYSIKAWSSAYGSYRREKPCVKNIFSRKRHDSNARDRKLSEAALR